MNSAAVSNATHDKGGWFGHAKRGIDALPIHLPVYLGGTGRPTLVKNW